MGWGVAVGKKLRFEVFKRDGFQCQYCGRTPPTVVLNCDHVIPVCEGGPDEMDNLITACFDCNSGKGGTPLNVIPEKLAAKMERQKEMAEQYEGYSDYLLELRRIKTESAHIIGQYWYKVRFMGTKDEDKWTFANPRIVSICNFLDHLSRPEIYDAIDIAFAKIPPPRSSKSDAATWKYFCGVCWNKVRAKQQGFNQEEGEGSDG